MSLEDLLSVVLTAVLTAVFGYAIFLLRKRWEEEHDAAARLSRDLQPILRAADDLIARIFGMLIETRDDLEFRTELPDEEIRAQYLTDIAVDSVPRQSSTIARLVRLLASIERFQVLNWSTTDVSYIFGWLLPPRETISLPGARYFLLNKIGMSLRGNAARSASGLPTEVQELIGRGPLTADGLEPDRPFLPPSIIELLRNLGENRDGHRLFCRMWRFLAVCEQPTNCEEPRVTPELATLAQFTTYLIDFQSIFSDTPKWSEFRVCLVKHLQEFNKEEGRRLYLYVPDDLAVREEPRYLATFPWIVTQKQLTQDGSSSAARSRYLDRRARKAAPRHAVAQLTESGVNRPDRSIRLSLETELPELMERCRKLFKTRQGLSPMR